MTESHVIDYSLQKSDDGSYLVPGLAKDTGYDTDYITGCWNCKTEVGLDVSRANGSSSGVGR